MNLKTTLGIVVVSLVCLIFQPAQAADAPKGPTLEQANSAVKELVILKGYLAGELDKVNTALVRWQDTRTNLQAASKAKGKGKAQGKAPVEPVKATTQGVKKP